MKDREEKAQQNKLKEKEVSLPWCTYYAYNSYLSHSLRHWSNEECIAFHSCLPSQKWMNRTSETLLTWDSVCRMAEPSNDVSWALIPCKYALHSYLFSPLTQCCSSFSFILSLRSFPCTGCVWLCRRASSRCARRGISSRVSLSSTSAYRSFLDVTSRRAMPSHSTIYWRAMRECPSAKHWNSKFQ